MVAFLYISIFVIFYIISCLLTLILLGLGDRLLNDDGGYEITKFYMCGPISFILVFMLILVALTVKFISHKDFAFERFFYNLGNNLGKRNK